MLATKVAAHRGYGITKRARQKVIEGFFLNWIHGSAYEFAVYQTHQSAVLILPHRTCATLTWLNGAAMCAHTALDAITLELFIK